MVPSDDGYGELRFRPEPLYTLAPLTGHAWPMREIFSREQSGGTIDFSAHSSVATSASLESADGDDTDDDDDLSTSQRARKRQKSSEGGDSSRSKGSSKKTTIACDFCRGALS